MLFLKSVLQNTQPELPGITEKTGSNEDKTAKDRPKTIRIRNAFKQR